MQEIRFWLGLSPDAARGAYSAPPDLLAGFNGVPSKGMGRKRRKYERDKQVLEGCEGTYF